jgi:hypothetical protein
VIGLKNVLVRDASTIPTPALPSLGYLEQVPDSGVTPQSAIQLKHEDQDQRDHQDVGNTVNEMSQLFRPDIAVERNRKAE